MLLLLLVSAFGFDFSFGFVFAAGFLLLLRGFIFGLPAGRLRCWFRLLVSVLVQVLASLLVPAFGVGFSSSFGFDAGSLLCLSFSSGLGFAAGFSFCFGFSSGFGFATGFGVVSAPVVVSLLV